MKKLIRSTFVIFAIIFYSCNKKQEVNTDIVASNTEVEKQLETPIAIDTEIKFDEEDFDFKDLKKGEKVSHEFFFTNIGDKPLIINKVDVSCGCTTPQYTKEPVAPGKKGSVTVTFDSTGFDGAVVKSFAVSGNFETKVMKFKANIN